MALLLPHSCFVHIAKTGGQSVRHALRALGHDTESDDPPGCKLVQQHRNHATPDEIPAAQVASRFLFTFIRHPVDWYLSYWSHRMRSPWILPQYPAERDAWDRAIASPAGWRDGRLFDEWAKRICKLHPGFLTRRYHDYTTRMHFIGQTENLLDDLNAALRMAGEDFRVDVLPGRNASRNRPKLNPETESLILDSEHGALEMWAATVS